MRNENSSSEEQPNGSSTIGTTIQVNDSQLGQSGGPNFARLFVRHEFVSPILTVVQDVVDIYRREQYPKNLLIMGAARSGKSRLVEKICGYGIPVPNQRFPLKTIFASEVPSPVSIKSLVTMLLYSLGVADPERGNTSMQTSRLIRLVQSLNIEMLVLDEFQHLVENRSSYVIEAVADWVKTLINQLKIPVVLVGLPECIAVFEQDDRGQLRGRFSKHLNIYPFEWKGHDPRRDGYSYSKLLGIIESELRLPCSSNLSDGRIAKRLLIASGGLIGFTVLLIEEAYRIAIRRNEQAISLELLEEAFEASYITRRYEFGNPFRASNKDIDLAIERPSDQATGSNGFNRRLRRKNRDQQTSLSKRGAK